MKRALIIIKEILKPRPLSPGFAKALEIAKKTSRIVLKVAVSAALVAVFAGVIIMGAFGLYVRQYLLPKADIEIGNININFTSIIYYKDVKTGEQKELTRLYGNENRIWVNYGEIPKAMKDAIIAIEDERFDSHKGVDWRRTLGAAANLVLPFSGNFGGSTITQQLIKNITDDKDVTIQRKVLEILRALSLERRLSKEQILEMYLNTINLSQGCYGVSSAAYMYFGKEAKDLTLAQCASLAGITNSPTYYDPFQNPDNNKERQELILGKMLELGFISQREHDSAVAEDLNFRDFTKEIDQSPVNVQSYFVDLLITEIISKLKSEYDYSNTIAYKLLYAGGLTIEATIDPEVQKIAEGIYEDRSNFPEVKGTTQPESAIVIMSNDGYLRGVVGGIGEKYGNLVLNRATSKRQPGSTIKPLTVYAPALEYGLITPYSVFDDSPPKLISKQGGLVEPESAILTGISVTPWPSNFQKTYGGMTTINRAVSQSLNTIPIRILDLLGLQTSFDFATSNFGLSLIAGETIGGRYYSDIGYSALGLGGLSMGLSLMEMTAAFVPFANEGIYMKPTTFHRVLDADGEMLLENADAEHATISEETAYYMRTMLEEVVKTGTATSAALEDFSVGGKTGTTSNDYDRWFIGFTPYYVTGVWFGFDINREISGLSTNPSVTTWKTVMEKLHKGLPPAYFEEPEGLATFAYCLDSGNIPTPACYNDPRGPRVGYGKYFVKDAPTSECTRHTFVSICSHSDKIAGIYCPEEDIEKISRLNLYRYFAVPGVVIADESYCVHYDGVLSDRVMMHYYPATGSKGGALEGMCNVHAEAPETTTTEVSAWISILTTEPPPVTQTTTEREPPSVTNDMSE